MIVYLIYLIEVIIIAAVTYWFVKYQLSDDINSKIELMEQGEKVE